MSLRSRIQDDMKAALRAKESARLAAIRLLLAAIKQREVDERIAELDDQAVLATIEKLVKQRRDAAAQYEAAGRAELAAAERFEIEVLSAYLPARLTEAEITAEIDAALAASGASTAADMGRAMAVLKPRLAGKADMGEVSRLLRARLSA
ncbi:GatB/YqeY domain-containing protein [Pseudothauera nasutitermitis]|uniref:GatB/YqeY domain-containing protein n=1 Tax=Pseudothauera nasutitermitis TaxID=2565930 RepID=A0A4V6RX49_9RHOO|nr:GatB/YqeY domain-containing protein [Pseudothauera nasutitermitis]THF61912.1 GatB/YqeY domain-containing protein [Pseudothauera nasutitermitis]